MDEADRETQTIRTYDSYAESWANDHPQDDYSTILDKLKSLSPGGSIIEIGCGGGQDAEMLQTISNDYLGTDASEGMVTLARRNHPGITFQHLNLYDLASLNKQYAIFWCNAVLLHIPRKRINEALQAISTVLKPAGIGFITMKDGDKEIFEQRAQSDRKENRIFVHWPKDEFEKTLNDNGFKVVYYEYLAKSERSQWHRFVVEKI